MDLSNNLKTLIKLLANGELVSHKYLALQLKCSEISLSNYIKYLIEIGLNISTIDHQYYQLTNQLCLLDLNLVEKQIPFDKIFYFYRINSTNTFLQITPNLTKGTLCIAEYQSEGKGRRNNKWFSPFGQNLYYSLLWEVSNLKNNITLISPLIAIAVIQALEDFGLKSGLSLKWPNDIYLDGKKLGGILTEVISFQPNKIKLVIGIGINLTMQDQTSEINQEWNSLNSTMPKIDKDKLVIYLSNHINQILVDFEEKILTDVINKFNQYDLFYNQEVTLFNQQFKIEGINRGINQKGEILIDCNGEILSFAIGDVSLRKK